jgi:outer membrane protein OmpA-like peptidoglycan-associated protein
MENISEVAVVDAQMVDTPPAGFTYVEDSLVVDDADDSGSIASTNPLVVNGIGIPVGGIATVSYSLRIGAGVGPGVYSNVVVIQDPPGPPIGNPSSADVEVVADPIMDDSLIIGSVFNDRNADGIQQPGEEGVPGVRIGSVEGLIMETDAFGRYHLVGISGGTGRGRNFLLKVDVSTLPAGTRFTTENPRVRRITPGLPVRFDFGVQLPVGELEGQTKETVIELGEVLFDPGSAQIRGENQPIITRIADAVRSHDGARLTITGRADEEGLAMQRAIAVRSALAAQLEPELMARVKVDLVAAVDPSQPLVSLSGTTKLGEVLFDTDRETLRPKFRPVIAAMAAELERRQGGVVEIVGRADKRASNEYNVQLGRRRAKAIYDAIVSELSPDARKSLRVEYVDSAILPVDSER